MLGVKQEPKLGPRTTWAATADALEAAGIPDPAVLAAAEAYLPLVDAVEAGLWMFWASDGPLVAVPAPQTVG
jgi:hypothetical protein